MTSMEAAPTLPSQEAAPVTAAPTPIEKGSAKNNSSNAKLPRSVAWRLRLGLLRPPKDTNMVMDLQEVVDANKELLEEQAVEYKRFQELYESHFHDTEKDEQGEEASDEQGEGGTQEEESDGTLVDHPTTATPDNAGIPMDPLTAMMMEQQAQENRRQELDLRYRKERALRKRGLAGNDTKKIFSEESETASTSGKRIDRDTLSIIDKDLHRLPDPDTTNIDGISIHWEKEVWIESLREMLYIYAQENAHIGYRQGMHEVASYLWLVFEVDRAALQEQQQSSSSTETIDKDCISLLFGREAAYKMLQSILTNVRQAFDVKVASNSRPLEDMSFSILAKIKQQLKYSRQPDHLVHLLQSLSVPPQLYCTKWIRLLFSREVVGAQNIIILWDVFVELVSEGWEWMAVLETTAASRILLYQDKLLNPSLAASTDPASLADHHHHAMNLLMNMPPMTDIEPLVTHLNQLLEIQRYQQSMPASMQEEENYVGTSDHYAQQPSYTNNQYPSPYLQQQSLRLNNIGEDLTAAFSLKAVKQSLEQGVEKLSTGGDALRKKLAEEWNGLKQQQQSVSGQFQSPMPSGNINRTYMMNTPLFDNDDDDMFEDINATRMTSVPNKNADPLMNALSANSQQRHYEPQEHHQQQQQQPQQPQTIGPGTNQMASLSGNGVVGSPPDAGFYRQRYDTGAQPHQLAMRLGDSVSILQDFIMNVARTSPNLNQQQHQQQPWLMNSFQNNGSNSGDGAVPNSVWEALAEVEAVRTVLLKQHLQGDEQQNQSHNFNP